MDKPKPLRNYCATCRKFRPWGRFGIALPLARGKDGHYMELICDDCLLEEEEPKDKKDEKPVV